MALKEVEKGPSEDRYWRPVEKGDYTEGYLYGFEDGTYGKQIVLYKGYDEENGEYILQTLPSHADLKRTYPNLVEDVFTRVEVVDIEEPKTRGSNPKFIYKVLQDVEDKMDFPNKDTPTVADDYYEN